ncbi:SH3 domain-containing protein [Leptolyngbya sp. 7M]|uniref:SH3 domain-containing protein n=1 Tax=Leptolyngbya sp. 7M TaxID=2812896 RepID=UPI001B8B7799|nr:SH3 domain-containing protein [Leptolyngbya sp. 7M]QYO62714.1 DUF4384 domain-containing protein [Leptolyngbya sp. 7M]
MKYIMGMVGVSAGMVMNMGLAAVVWAEQPLSVVYPSDGHETTAAQIFLIGTAPPAGEVTVNGQPIERSTAGHFAPSFPLQLGENTFTLRYQDQELVLRVTRTDPNPTLPLGTGFAEGSLVPAVDIARLPNEPICFSAIAPAPATVSVSLSNQTIALLPQPSSVNLPPNSAVLTFSNQPAPSPITTYQGCMAVASPGDLGVPEFQLTLNGSTVRQSGPGRVSVIAPAQAEVVEVTADSGTARSGPSTDYSRLTPLPKGTQASVTGREGEWLRLDYGGWIRASETQAIPNAALPRTLIRSIRAGTVGEWTEIAFPLQVPVPMTVQQGNRSFALTLHNTTAQTDTIFLNDDPVIERLDWQQAAPSQVQYTFNLKSAQQWGYKLRYVRLTQNQGSSRLGVRASLEILAPQERLILQQETVRAQRTMPTTKVATLLMAEGTPTLSVGSQIQYRLYNYSEHPVYFLLLGLDTKGNALIFYPNLTPTAAAAINPLAPGEAVTVPQAHAANWLVQPPNGVAETHLVCSRAPFTQTYQVLADMPVKVPAQEVAVLLNPLDVVQAILHDLHQASSELLPISEVPSDVYALDVNAWATLSFVYQVSGFAQELGEAKRGIA